jgi:hypothetical protein
MAEWKTAKDAFGDKPLAVLGGRTMRQNYEHWNAKWAKGEGTVDATDRSPIPYGPRYAGHWPPGWKPGHAVRPNVPPPDLAGTLEEHLARVGVSDRLSAILRTSLRATPAVLAVRAWLQSDKSILLLDGQPGTGKSCAAATAFLEAKRPRWLDGEPDWDSTGAFVDAADIAGNLFTDATKELLTYLAVAPLVVIDELGVETASAPWHSALDTLVNKRFGDPKLRTVLATNVSAARDRRGPEKPSPFQARYGDRIARRIREAGTVFHAERVEAQRTPEPRGDVLALGAAGAA